MYVIYLKSLYSNKGINECIDIIETTLKKYKKDEDLSDARKLIQRGFKEELYTFADKKFNS